MSGNPLKLFEHILIEAFFESENTPHFRIEKKTALRHDFTDRFCTPSGATSLYAFRSGVFWRKFYLQRIPQCLRDRQKAFQRQVRAVIQELRNGSLAHLKHISKSFTRDIPFFRLAVSPNTASTSGMQPGIRGGDTLMIDRSRTAVVAGGIYAVGIDALIREMNASIENFRRFIAEIQA